MGNQVLLWTGRRCRSHLCALWCGWMSSGRRHGFRQRVVRSGTADSIDGHTHRAQRERAESITRKLTASPRHWNVDDCRDRVRGTGIYALEPVRRQRCGGKQGQQWASGTARKRHGTCGGAHHLSVPCGHTICQYHAPSVSTMRMTMSRSSSVVTVVPPAACRWWSARSCASHVVLASSMARRYAGICSAYDANGSMPRCSPYPATVPSVVAPPFLGSHLARTDVTPAEQSCCRGTREKRKWHNAKP